MAIDSHCSAGHVAGVAFLSNLGFAIMLIQGQFQWPGHILWQIVSTTSLRLPSLAERLQSILRAGHIMLNIE